MATIHFDATDFFTLGRRYAGAEQIIGQEMARGIDRVTIRGEAITKQNTPVRTGHLRRSVTHKPATFGGGQASGSWGTATPYARWVEEGRGPVVASPGKMLRFVIGGKVLYRKRVGPASGRHMFRTAMISVRPMVRTEMSAAMRRAMARMGGS